MSAAHTNGADRHNAKCPRGRRLATTTTAAGTTTTATTAATGAVAAGGDIKILTSCPSCLQGLKRYEGDLQSGLLQADYIVVEMARQILGEDWLPAYVQRANAGGIERVLV